MRKLLDKLAMILMEPVNKVVTVFLGVYTILWGMWVVNPYVDTFTSAKLYSALISFIPQEFLWGSMAILFGLLTIVGLIRHLPKTVFYGAGAAGIHWFVISVFYFMGDVTNTGGITALFIALLSAYIYLNCKVNYNKDLEEHEL